MQSTFSAPTPNAFRVPPPVTPETPEAPAPSTTPKNKKRKKKKSLSSAKLASISTLMRNATHGMKEGLTIQPPAGMAGSVC
ncbi:hypothetical protein N7536_009229 [Penicillium majusculum]|uniref:Uncharacterized protein n=1 Tax=Penicillium solitum TaxID=60172 RepID=A0A1V6R2Z2_9EURO|nr:uncharacterized protein PENSOL_c018G03988 [Penicillium solitum]KAJ5686610.1 hypothetical protein N7536_009229 [Penicillium majusculum]OQD95848.1 hypothetical protein PENSOL_c018G03988 [Penicillium solitum]